MSTISAPPKPATVTMTFTVSMNLPSNPSLTTLDKLRQAAAEAKLALAKLGGTITGSVTIGKQKFKLED